MGNGDGKKARSEPPVVTVNVLRPRPFPLLREVSTIGGVTEPTLYLGAVDASPCLVAFNNSFLPHNAETIDAWLARTEQPLLKHIYGYCYIVISCAASFILSHPSITDAHFACVIDGAARAVCCALARAFSRLQAVRALPSRKAKRTLSAVLPSRLVDRAVQYFSFALSDACDYLLPAMLHGHPHRVRFTHAVAVAEGDTDAYFRAEHLWQQLGASPDPPASCVDSIVTLPPATFLPATYVSASGGTTTTTTAFVPEPLQDRRRAFPRPAVPYHKVLRVDSSIDCDLSSLLWVDLASLRNLNFSSLSSYGRLASSAPILPPSCTVAVRSSLSRTGIAFLDDHDHADFRLPAGVRLRDGLLHDLRRALAAVPDAVKLLRAPVFLSSLLAAFARGDASPGLRFFGPAGVARTVFDCLCSVEVSE